MGTADAGFGGRSNAGHPLSTIQSGGCGDLHGGEVLRSSPLLSGLSIDDYARLLAGARVKHFVRGDVLYVEGDPVEEVLLLDSGLVKITKIGACGTVVILGLAGPGEALGAANLFSTGQYTATAETVCASRVLALAATTFRLLVESRPVLLSRMFQVQAEWLRELEERFHEMATDMVGTRVARQLVRLHEKMVPSGNDHVEIRISHEELAQMTGTNLYTISRLFSEWEDSGVVRFRRQAVMVRDVQSLREMYDRR